MLLFVLNSVLCLLSFLTTATPELTCTNLNIGTSIPPFSGISLSYCPSTRLQCCTEEYFQEKVNTTKQSLTSSLRDELLEGNYRIFCTIIMELRNYIEDTFLPEFASRLQLVDKLTPSGRDEISRSFVNTISSNLEINTSSSFNFSMYFDSFISTLKFEFINQYLSLFVVGGLNSIRRNCLKTILDGKTNVTAVQAMKNNIEWLRKIYSVLNIIKQWYELDLVSKVLRVPFTKTCIDSFIQLRCTACVQNIPPLCQSVCRYLVQGCFVPFRQGLRAQLNILWNVTQQLIEELAGEKNLRAFCDGKNLLTINFDDSSGFNNLAAAAAAQCSTFLSKSLGRKRRSSNSPVTLPNGIINNVTALNGSFSYDINGPLRCQASPINNCWDGEQEKIQDDISIDFDDSIENQDLNPVISFNRTELVQTAQAFGTPVSVFLEHTLADIDIEIPTGALFQLIIEPRPAPSRSRSVEPATVTSLTTDVLSSTDIGFILNATSSASIDATSTNVLTYQPNMGYYLTPSSTIIIFSILLMFEIFI